MKENRVMSSLQSIGGTFKMLREKRGYTLKEAAGTIVTPQFLSQFERDKKSMSVENFSQLLVSIGVDWDEFAQQYDGERVMTIYRIVNDYLQDKNHKGHMSSIAVGIKDHLKEHYSANPDLKELVIRLFTLYDSSVYHQPLEVTDKDRYFIEQLGSREIFNLPEYDFIALLIDEFPLSLVLTLRDTFLASHQLALNLNSRTNSHGTLIYIISYLSRHGYPIEAQKTIDAMRENIFNMDHRMIYEKIELDIEEIYNLLRQNKVEALAMARDMIALLETLENYTEHKRHILKTDEFKKTAFALNKTGKPLYD